MKYISKHNTSFFKKLTTGHEYVIKWREPSGHQYSYIGHIIYDVTTDEDMNVYCSYSNEKSIRRDFEFERLDIDD